MADPSFTSSRTPPGYLGATWIPRSVLVLHRPGSSGPLAALVAARSHLGPENLPGTDAASRKYGMDQLAEVGFFPWPEYSGLSCDRFERLDQPHLPAKPLRASLAQSVTALRSSGYGERIFLMAASS